VTEFISTLFGSCLKVPYFITYKPVQQFQGTSVRNQIGSYIHQIFTGPLWETEGVHVKELLHKSMEFQGIRFEKPPGPFLMIKLPVSGGNLVGMKSVLPNKVLKLKSNVLGIERKLTEINYMYP